MEHIESKYSLHSKLFFVSICSIRIRSRTRDIIEISERYSSETISIVCSLSTRMGLRPIIVVITGLLDSITIRVGCILVALSLGQFNCRFD